MKIIAILITAMLAVFTTTYHPTETFPIEADTPAPIIQQEHDATPTVVEETPPDAVAASPQPQESDMAPAADTGPVSAGTAETIVEAMPVNEETDPPMEVTPAVVAPAPVIEEPIIVESAKTDIPAVVEHAKTSYAGEDITPAEPPVIKPEQPMQTADIVTAIAAAEAFAIETYNVTIDPTLDFDNSTYRFPAAVPLTVDQDTLNYKAIDIVHYTFEQQIRQYGITIEKLREAGIRCRVYVEQTEHDLLVYCFYA